LGAGHLLRFRELKEVSLSSMKRKLLVHTIGDHNQK